MSKILLNEQSLVINPSLARAVGLNEAIIIQQLYCLLENSNNSYEGKTWLYITYADWHKYLPFFSESTIRRIIKRLEKLEIIISTNRFNKMDSDNTKWYTIDYETLDGIFKDKNIENGFRAQDQDVSGLNKCMKMAPNKIEQTEKPRLPELKSDDKKPSTVVLNQNGFTLCSKCIDGQTELGNLDTGTPAYIKLQSQKKFEKNCMSILNSGSKRGLWNVNSFISLFYHFNDVDVGLVRKLMLTKIESCTGVPA
ncbi:MAG: hypothetical protein APF76_04810 [Desulfitibacter sp. BRH_c19]|nr:MAG: hypothetical protein APF76_04810 [Desulfitibacter sp. BRH_c19]